MRINLGGKFVSGLLDRVEDVSEGRWYKISNWNWKWIRFLSEKKYLKDENILFFLVGWKIYKIILLRTFTLTELTEKDK